MRTSNASLSYPFDSTPFLFPESENQIHDRSSKQRDATSSVPATPDGSWRYRAAPRHRAILFLAMLISAGAHAGLFFGFTTKRAEDIPVVPVPTMAIALVKMPDLPEDPEEKIEDLNTSEEIAEGVDVPRQADFPTSVILDNSITQAFDPRSLQPHLDVAGTKLVAIPTNMRVGGSGGKGKEIFNLADLDRAPSPIFQPPPNIPAGLRVAGAPIKLGVEFIVNNKGEVVDARVLESTDRRYDEVALAAVMKWKFKPGIRKGRAVATRILQPFVISVSKEE